MSYLVKEFPEAVFLRFVERICWPALTLTFLRLSHFESHPSLRKTFLQIIGMSSIQQAYLHANLTWWLPGKWKRNAVANYRPHKFHVLFTANSSCSVRNHFSFHSNIQFLGIHLASFAFCQKLRTCFLHIQSPTSHEFHLLRIFPHLGVNFEFFRASITC